MDILDAVYGKITLSDDISILIMDPLVQRLRHIRLSNIDSIQMPGIANISRFEHSIGTCYLVSQLGLYNNLTSNEKLTVQAAALLHDCLISPYGHLVEEAMAFLNILFDHEKKFINLLPADKNQEAGGIHRQLLFGRSPRLHEWLNKMFQGSNTDRLKEISDIIQGKGTLGKLISGAVDLDNLDNVVRAAYHMGLSVDKNLPIKLANEIHFMKSEIAFGSNSLRRLEEWLDLREQVYSLFMLSKLDFAGKLMIIYSTIDAIKEGILTEFDWDLNDITFANKLLNSYESKDKKVMKSEMPFVRWLVGDFWNLSNLFWMDNLLPKYSTLIGFNEGISERLGRKCYSYRIKDKRTRQLKILLDTGELCVIGEKPDRWLLGVGSPLRKQFTKKENEIIVEYACEYFSCDFLGVAKKDDKQEMLF